MKAHIDFPAGPDEAGARLRLAFAAPLACYCAHAPDQVAGVLDAALAAARAGRWAVGWVAYEAAPAFDAALRVQPPATGWPLAAFAAYAAPAPPLADAGDFSCGPWRTLTPMAQDLAAIDALRRRIAAGDFYQVNLTTRLRATFSGSAAALFEALRASQPDGYCIHLAHDDREILSVSPELFFDWRPDGALLTRPMKGTAPRQADAAADAAAARALRASAKERAENVMIVDLLRNDLARVALAGSVRVPGLFEIDALPTAWQMSSRVTATTRPGVGLADVFAALFPCGSVAGAPKVAAMAAIAALEPAPRGAYCGAIGLIRPGGHATFNVGIRTVVLDRRAGTAECGVGSGIVHDSAAAAEYAEWLVKRRFLLRASAGFELLETLALRAGRCVLADRHLARLAAGAAHFGFAYDPDRARAALAAVAAQASGDCIVRLLCDRQGRMRTECAALGEAPAEARAILAAAPIAGEPDFLLHKTTERSAYRPFDPPAGIFDTLLWNDRGELTEFTRGNLVVEIDGARLTPPLSCGLLPGTQRAAMLARGEIAEGVVRVADLARARALWFINSVRGCIPVRLTNAAAPAAIPE